MRPEGFETDGATLRGSGGSCAVPSAMKQAKAPVRNVHLTVNSNKVSDDRKRRDESIMTGGGYCKVATAVNGGLYRGIGVFDSRRSGQSGTSPNGRHGSGCGVALAGLPMGKAARTPGLRPLARPPPWADLNRRCAALGCCCRQALLIDGQTRLTVGSRALKGRFRSAQGASPGVSDRTKKGMEP